MGPWYLHLPKSTFWDLFTCKSISWLLKAVKHGAFFSHLNGHWTSARPLPWRSTKFVAFKSLLITLKLSSSHSYQPLVLISTAQCITRLRSKRVFAKHSKSRDHHRYIDHPRPMDLAPHPCKRQAFIHTHVHTRHLIHNDSWIWRI